MLAVPVPFVNLWDMNGVSFAGAVACLAGVLTLLGFLIATVRRGPARAPGGPGERAEGSYVFCLSLALWSEGAPRRG